ncbi:hypothetical protein EDD18DRAFT_1358673 [Armillaria luteobubalina]|uniref:Uncharacterized protein n=1 Tax=Armillaria luteobubalina TaxID=153913 RepID=A0AA39PT41_9AGAR|nr:hypothetical protein EDD18DRAFT_1358673 [Armillaria luteobubalina]
MLISGNMIPWITGQELAHLTDETLKPYHTYVGAPAKMFVTVIIIDPLRLQQ